MDRPPKNFRQIGNQKWEYAINVMNNDNSHCIIVSQHFTGWVYLSQKMNDKKFRCMTYKLNVNPFEIKNQLYNYTISNGNLVDSFIYDLE